MSHRVKVKITKQVYGDEDYKVLSCFPLEKNEEIKVHPKYGNFTIVGSLPMLDAGEEVELIVEEDANAKRPFTYVVVDVPSLTQLEITDAEEIKILKSLTTDTQTDNIHSAYPNFCRLIIAGREEEIDTDKINNVGEKRLQYYIREITAKYRYYNIMQRFQGYKIDFEDCKELCKIFPTIEDIINAMEENPYKVLIDILNYSFSVADRLIMTQTPEYAETDVRCEYLIDYVLTLNESGGKINSEFSFSGGDTKIDANLMFQCANLIAPECLNNIKKVVTNSLKFHYNDETKYIAKMDTYVAEQRIADFIREKVENPIVLNWEWEKFKEIKDGTLTDEQSSVLKEFCQSNFGILNAPSGTGKSSTMMALVHMMEDYKMSYTLLAPTGKASKRLSEQTGRKCSTIHSATAGNQGLDTECIIIDEGSFLSVELMIMIINAITYDGARVWIIGDTHQLPSIGAGRIMEDIVESEVAPICTLTKVFRFGEDDIATVSEMSRKGEIFLTETNKYSKKSGEYRFIPYENKVSQVVDIYMEMIDSGIKSKDIIVMSPINKYEMGTINLNNLIQASANPPRPKQLALSTTKNGQSVNFRAKDLVLVTKNNKKALTLEGYELLKSDPLIDPDSSVVKKTAIVNGDIGTVMDVKEDYIVVQIDEEYVVFKKSGLNDTLLGYTITVHKMQGSESPNIIVLTLPEHEMMNNRSSLYTALTRAKKKVVHIGTEEAVAKALSNIDNHNRNTYLKEMLIHV